MNSKIGWYPEVMLEMNRWKWYLVSDPTPIQHWYAQATSQREVVSAHHALSLWRRTLPSDRRRLSLVLIVKRLKFLALSS